MRSTSRRGLSALFYGSLIIGVCLRLFLAFYLPLDDNEPKHGVYGFNDEPSHLAYVRYLLERRELPVQEHDLQNPRAFSFDDFEYYQPPLAYVCMVPFYWVGSVVWGNPKAGTRLLSVLGSLFLIYLTFRVGCLFHPNIGCWAAAGTALFPSQVYFSILTSNDCLSWCLTFLFVYLLMKGPEEWPLKTWCFVVIVLTLGFYTKTSMATVVPLLFLSVLFRKDLRGKIRATGRGLSVLLIVFALTLPWHLRNLQLYGSLFALSAGSGPPVSWASFSSDHRRFIFAWCIGTFVWPLNLRLFTSGDYLNLGAFIVGGSVLAFGVSVRRALTAFARRELLVLIAHVVLTLTSYCIFFVRYAQGESRLFYGCLPSIMIVGSMLFGKSVAAAQGGKRHRRGGWSRRPALSFPKTRSVRRNTSIMATGLSPPAVTRRGDEGGVLLMPFEGS